MEKICEIIKVIAIFDEKRYALLVSGKQWPLSITKRI